MKRLAPILLTLLFLAPAAPAEAAPKQQCIYSPTRGWELVDGGKVCKKMARKFVRVTRRHAGWRPSLSSCSTRKPRRIWRCSASHYRTTNIEKGDILTGRFQKAGGRWRVKGLRFPTPRY